MSTKQLDRKARPKTSPVSSIPFEFPGKTIFSNGVEFYHFHDDAPEVLRLEFRYPAGKAKSVKKLDAAFASKLITAGTSTMTEKQIAEKIDYYGAYFEKDLGDDDASFSVFMLKKYAPEVLAIVNEVIHDPVYPESEIEILRNIRKKKFLVKSEKVNFLARRELSSALFGPEHPYGGKTELEDFDKLKREDVLAFHRNHYAGKPIIMAAGNVDKELLGQIEVLFGSRKYPENTQDVKKFMQPAGKTGRIVVEKADVVQSAIRVGRLMFNRTHPDFAHMQVLVTLLGGYFGSRLMSNLREDKGYTYGVNSALASLKHAGFFYIVTEVGAEVTKSAENEIFAEIGELREKTVGKEELELVKSYLLGQILRSTDGVFARMDRFKLLHSFGQNASDFHKMVEGIRQCTATQVKDLAVQWLKDEDMLTVIAGKG